MNVKADVKKRLAELEAAHATLGKLREQSREAGRRVDAQCLVDAQYLIRRAKVKIGKSK